MRSLRRLREDLQNECGSREGTGQRRMHPLRRMYEGLPEERAVLVAKKMILRHPRIRSGDALKLLRAGL